MTNLPKTESIAGSQKGAATGTAVTQTTAAPALSPSRALRSREFQIPKPDVSTAALEARVVKAVGSHDRDFVNGILSQLIAAGELGRKTDDLEVNFLLSVIEGMEPRDIVDAMLAAQMALVHVQIIQLARHLNRVVHLPERELVVSAFTKMTRTFAMQVEARLRHRTGGRNLMVGHVSVTDQSIVANVTNLPSEAARDNAATSAPLLVEGEPKPVTTTAHVEPASPRYKGERVKRRRKLQNSRTVQDK
jgi:hypothetical protein